MSPCPSMSLCSYDMPCLNITAFLRVTPTHHRSPVLGGIWGRGTTAGGCRGSRAGASLNPSALGTPGQCHRQNQGPCPVAQGFGEDGVIRPVLAP